MLSFKKKSFKKALKVSIIVILIFITLSALSTVFVYNSVFDRYDSGIDEMHLSAKSENITKFTRHTYTSGENKLKGYWYQTNPKEDLVVIVPGFHAETDDFIPYINAFCDHNYDVFIFDCTGHGESGGDSAEGFPQIIPDLNATIDYIKSKSDYKNIHLFGHSRGAYAACCVLKDRNDIKSVVAVNGVDCAMDGIMAYSYDTVGAVAYINYPFLWSYQAMLFGTELNDRSASECINSSDANVLVIQSTGDENLSADRFSIYAQKSHTDARFVLYDKKGRNGHTNILYDGKNAINPDILSYALDLFEKN
ncbi:MAG: alpha/beta fold hydrolase [Clostridia bacterium]|nr:alpha/beta fold hydrolase [Clostridia bacterium]